MSKEIAQKTSWPKAKKRYLLRDARGKFLCFGKTGGWETVESTGDARRAWYSETFEGAKYQRDREGHLRHGSWSVVELTETLVITKVTKLGPPPPEETFD